MRWEVGGEETVVVTLADGRNFVLVPGSEWQSIDETAYLTSTAANGAALSQSLKEAEGGRTVEVERRRTHKLSGDPGAGKWRQGSRLERLLEALFLTCGSRFVGDHEHAADEDDHRSHYGPKH